MNKLTQIFLIITLITLVLWVHSIPSLPIQSTAPLRLISQLTANLTLVFMSISLILTMKLHIIDRAMKGMNISYKFHALIGSLAFVTMVAHPLLLVIHSLPDLNQALVYVFFGNRTAANLGLAAFYSMLFALTFTKLIKLRYQIWLLTHRILGISFLLASLHAFLAPSVLVRSPLLTSWIALWIILGLSATLYSSVLYRILGAHYKYKISSINHLDDYLNLELIPLNQPINFLPGQYIYARFHSQKIEGELHPFSPSSMPRETTLRLSIKKLGDFTQKIQNALQVNDKVTVYGPFGNFGDTYINQTGDMIWIAGGGGITPFLSILREEYVNPTNKKILFYYSINKQHEAVFDKEIKELVQKLSNITYIKWVAEESGFLTMAVIMKKWAEINGTPFPKILLCGPPPMMKAMTTQSKKSGIPEEDLIFEQFNFL